MKDAWHELMSVLHQMAMVGYLDCAINQVILHMLARSILCLTSFIIFFICGLGLVFRRVYH